MTMGYVDGSRVRPRTTVSRCHVNAGGVTAEWIEAVAATAGQPTLVFFGPGGTEPALMAIATGARVLHVGTQNGRHHPGPGSVEDGIRAWAWLLGEGCDVTTTAFIEPSAGAYRAVGVLLTAQHRGFSIPLAGAWSTQHVGERPPNSHRADLRTRLTRVGAVEVLAPRVSRSRTSRSSPGGLTPNLAPTRSDPCGRHWTPTERHRRSEA